MVRFAELNGLWRTQCFNHGFTVLDGGVPAANADMILPDHLVDQVQAIADGLLLLGFNVVVRSLYITNGQIAFPYVMLPTSIAAAGGGC